MRNNRCNLSLGSINFCLVFLGSPVKFRIVLGTLFLNWQTDIYHSNISHAGYRDQVIYLGQSLLQHLFTEGNQALRQKILDEDELRHLEDLSFTHEVDSELLEELEEMAKIVAIQTYLKNPTPLIIRCETMDYPWGDKEFIPALLRIDNSGGKPYAELWIGAHPKAPAKANIIDIEIDLDGLIKVAAEEILGEEVTVQFNRQLPYLFKVLTAALALSIQAHPNKAQAEQGFGHENTLGIDLKAYNRNYKDDNHKPEIICAITNFWAINGFRPIEDIISSFDELDVPELRDELNAFKQAVEGAGEDIELRKKALKDFYTSLMKRAKVLKIGQAQEDQAKIDAAQAEITPIVSHVVNEAKKRISQALGAPIRFSSWLR